jgi:peptidoglycan/LPS O-acetylase OafA/YrhL
MSAVANSPRALHKPTQVKSKYRPEIDGLRAFAVVAVIINHFNKDLLPSGYLGVDIFFVISGYVITSSLAGRESKNFLDFLTGFYERRIKRLVPALVVFVLITSVLISLFNPDPGVALGLGWKSLFGVSNISLYRSSTDYFAQSTELNPFTHTWSLGVEEQFYLLFPFLIWFSGFGQQTAKGARNLFFWVGALTIASLIGFIYLYQVNQPAAYFLMPPRFWEMAAGCLIFIGFQKRARIEQALEKVPPLLVVAAMVGVMFLPVSAAVPATIGVVALSAVLIASLKKGTVAYKFFTLEKLVYVGLISYSLYLWHWTVLSISRWTIGIHWWSVPIQVGLMVLMAISSYSWIEKPLRMTSAVKNSQKVIFAGMSTILLGTILVALIGRSAKAVYRFSVSALSVGYGQEDNRIIHSILECRNGELRKCLVRNKNESAIFVVGDSHAENHIPSIDEAIKKIYPKMQIRHWWSYGFWTALQGGDSDKTQAKGNPGDLSKFLELIDSELKQGDIVVFSWYRNRVLKNFGEAQSIFKPQEDKNKTLSLERELSKIASVTERKGATLLLVDDIPQVCEFRAPRKIHSRYDWPFMGYSRWIPG